MILLLKTDHGFFAVAALSAHNDFRITDTKLIFIEEITFLQTQKEILARRGIVVVDLTKEAASSEDLSSYASSILLSGELVNIPTYSSLDVIPSPYFISSFDDSKFLSTQKTRGPNIF